jgi:lipoyl(octanoyl) transferase
VDVAAPTLDPGPSREAVAGGPLEARWLGRIGYRDAWALQHELVERRVAGEIPDQLLLLEHDAVLTLGRQSEESHVLASAGELAARGIELIRVERGGEVTYHGPGQLVAYPILALSRRSLLVRPLVRALEAAMTDTCAAFGVVAGRREGHPGCWCEIDGAQPRKIGALGLRVERGVSYHGIALNVDPDLADFDLIDPCGMPGVVSTSIAHELGLSLADQGRGSRLHAPGYTPLAGPDFTLKGPSDPSRFDAPAGITGIHGWADGARLAREDGRRSEQAHPTDPAAARTTVDAPRGITEGSRTGGLEHENGAFRGDAQTGITRDPLPRDASVERAARIFARALAAHLAADLQGFAATDRPTRP